MSLLLLAALQILLGAALLAEILVHGERGLFSFVLPGLFLAAAQVPVALATSGVLLLWWRRPWTWRFAVVAHALLIALWLLFVAPWAFTLFEIVGLGRGSESPAAVFAVAFIVYAVLAGIPLAGFAYFAIRTLRRPEVRSLFWQTAPITVSVRVGVTLGALLIAGSLLLVESRLSVQASHAAVPPFPYRRAIQAVSPDGRLVAAGHDASTVNIGRLSSGPPLTFIDQAVLWAFDLRSAPGSTKIAGSELRAFSPDSKLLATGGSDPWIRLWDTSSWDVRKTLGPHERRVNSLAFSTDGEHLAAAGYREVKIWSVSRGQLAARLPGFPAEASTVAWSPDGRLLAAGGWQIVRLFEVPSWRMLSEHAYPGWTNDLAFSANGRFLAAGGEFGVMLVNVETGMVTTIPMRSRSLAFDPATPDILAIAIGSPWPRVSLWDVSAGRERASVAGPNEAALAFLPGTNTLSLSVHSPELVDAVTGQPVAVRVRDRRGGAGIGVAPREVQRKGPGFGSTEFVYDEESRIAR